MKKMFTLFVVLITYSGVFAQSDSRYDNRRNDNTTMTYSNRDYDNHDGYDRPDHAVEMKKEDSRFGRDGQYNKYDRRVETDRINHDYDRRINEYRNNRRMNSFERDREIERLRRERNDRLKAIGSAVLVGGVIGVLIGSHL